MSEILRPKTFYEWLLLLKPNGLKLSRLEGLHGSLVHHALSNRSQEISFGFWDHQSCTGFIDLATPVNLREKGQKSEWDILRKL